MTAARGATSFPPLQLVRTDETPNRAQALRQRAEHLRRSALTMHSLVARAYLRRASELELEAWLTEMRSGELGGAAA